MGYSIRALPLSCALLTAALLLSGCQGDGAGNPTATPRGTQAFPLSLALTTNKTSYIPGEVVHSIFTITNVGTQTAYYSNPTLDATVSRNGQVVWQHSKVMGTSAQGVTVETLDPGRSAPLPLDWDQRDQQGNFVAPGQYTLLVWMASGALEGSTLAPAPLESTLAAPPVTFTIQNVPVPAVPAAPTLTATGGSGVSLLSWTAASGAAGYHLYRGYGNGAPDYLIGTTPAAQFTFSDSTVQPGNQYSYVVRAFNIAGIEGPDSNTVNIQT